MKLTSNTTRQNSAPKPPIPIRGHRVFETIAIWYSMMNTSDIQDLPPRVANTRQFIHDFERKIMIDRLRQYTNYGELKKGIRLSSTVRGYAIYK